jgi:hypothetical protein
MEVIQEEKMENIKTFYIAASGNDGNPGSEDQPFATFERAQLEVRSWKSKHEQPITILAREGTYYLANPLVFESVDSGTDEHPIIYSSYPEETAVISGGVSITGEWRPYKNGIMMCDLPEAKAGTLKFTQLFINGKRQIRARYPNQGYIHLADRTLEWPHTFVHYDPSTFTLKRWEKPDQAEIHIFGKHNWGNLQWAVKDIDWDTHTIHFGKGGHQINDIMQGEDATGLDERSRFFIENVFEELDSPGEWYLDTENGILYVMPEKGVELARSLVEAPILTTLVSFSGTQEKPVSHITFSGFRFAHTAVTYMNDYEAPSLGDWTIHRSGAVYYEGTECCTVRDCFFDAVGGNAVFMNNYNRQNLVYGNLITGAGDSAICLVGSKHLTLGTTHSYPSEIQITNNNIHHIGIFGKQTAGVFISISRDNVISHNHIYDIPRAAICINDGTWGGHVIEFNDIHDTVKETGDHGPFNSWGRDRYWCLQQSHGPASHEAGDVKKDARRSVIIRNNRFVDHSGWGIDLDDGSSNYHVYNNLCIGISIKLREGDFRTIENNIFVNGANPPGFHIGYENNHDCFTRNIIVANTEADNPEVDINFEKGDSKGKLYEFIGPPIEGKWLEEMDHNLFFNDLGYFKATVHFRPLGNKSEDYSLAEWQALGLDEHSIYSDPLFINPESGDYRVHNDSPAIRLGFKNFDMNRFGLLPDYRFG